MKFLFWVSITAIFFAYFGYPLILYLYQLLFGQKIEKGAFEPHIDIIIPAYNEQKVIRAKIKNTLALDYPVEKRTIHIISDCSTDGTDEIIKEYLTEGVQFIRKTKRQGKAAALNKGLSVSNSEVVIFTDASILLTRSAIRNILRPLKDPTVGCVSGEDHIPDGGGEGMYGRYELMLRNFESRCSSIVGASGCFYAQRRIITTVFTEGRAPDFLSVLETIKKGYRAVTEPSAIGLMGRVGSTNDEFVRKLRTIIRGITTLIDYKYLLNPFRYGFFAIELIFHKIVRWLVGLFMVVAFISNIFLLDVWQYAIVFVLQILFYGLAIIGWYGEKGNKNIRLLMRIPLFFCIANLATIIAWAKYFLGTRQELWESSKR